jgi:hypothetical protein
MHQISGWPALEVWRAELEDADVCPYVGPRPQMAGRDEGMLIGRRRDLERTIRAVLHRSLVLLDGDSGVGKSSLLQNGLLTELKSAGFTVLINRNWIKKIDLNAEGAVDRYLASAIERTHAEPGHESLADSLKIGPGTGLCDALRKVYGEASIVLILDQFEELLRQDGSIAKQVVRWVIESGYRDTIRVIISLRTDSHYRLDPLLRGVKPFSMDRVRLEELERNNDIRKVIETFRPRDKPDPPIEQLAVERLMQLWEDHKPKLLDLQATLFALYYRSPPRDVATGGDGVASDDRLIRVQDVVDLERDAIAKAEKNEQLTPFTMGLREAIRLKIEHAEKACECAGVDDYLLFGTRDVVRRIAPVLSSGDFKIPIHQFDLVWSALDREVRVLERALIEEHTLVSGEDFEEAWGKKGDIVREKVNALITTLLEHGLSAIPPSDLARVARVGDIVGQGGAQRRRDETAGPMMHRSATATLGEEVRRVLFAIEWLERTEIIRKDADGIVLLVHDRAGEALRRWVRTQGDEPEPKLRQLTGARGEHYVWMGKHQVIGNFDTAGYRVIANVSWRDCRITTRFRNVVFVNCDFSGSRFFECEFEGVTFVNCLLDDANFESCTIKGEPEKDRKPVVRPKATVGGGGVTRLGPSFTIGASKEEIGHFMPYSEFSASEGSWFFSDTSGVPAVPGGQPDPSGELLAHFDASATTGSAPPAADSTGSSVRVIKPTPGGVAMIGGRLCFLTLYRCKADDEKSPFALHHVSGGGFDIVEHNGGLIDIHDGAIRGISVTRDPIDSAEGASSQASIDLTVTDSLIVNTYLADHLAGEATIKNSVVLMLLNASDSEQFSVQISDSRYQFVVNTNEPDGSEDSRDRGEASRYFDLIPGTHSRFHARNRRPLAFDLEKMDYRARPELWEARQRERRALARSAATGISSDISHLPAGALGTEEVSACD